MLNLTQFPIITLAKTINVLIPANTTAGTSIFLPYDAEINNSILRGAMINNASTIISTYTNGIINISNVDLNLLYINLTNEKEEVIIDSLPCKSLVNYISDTNKSIRRFNTKINLSKSFIKLTDVLTNDANQNQLLSITFYYKPIKWQ
jgi:hypothetical protein